MESTSEPGNLSLTRIDAALRRFREGFPNADFGRRLTKEEEERILGFGRDGV